MKRVIAGFLCGIMAITATPAIAEQNDMAEFPEDTDALYRVGDGAYDGSYTTLSKSLLGWGIGLAIGIGILCALLHQSTSTSHD